MAIARVRALIDGQWVTLENKGRYWEGEVIFKETSRTQPGGYYNVTVEATNEEGTTATANGDYVPGLRQVVREVDPPVIALVSPPEGYVTTKEPVVVWDVTDVGSGIASFSVLLDGATAACESVPIADGYRVTYRGNALDEGKHRLTVRATDNDENTAEQDFNYIVDTVPPKLKVLFPDGHYIVDWEAMEFSGETNDEMAPDVTIEVTHNGEKVSVPVVDGMFSYVVPLKVGENYVNVKATDGVGWTTEESYYVIRLITDRTVEDSSRLASLIRQANDGVISPEDFAFLAQANSKGGYNYTDLNRVTIAMEFLDRRLKEYGYFAEWSPLEIEDGRTRWNVEDEQTVSQMAHYLGNVEAFRVMFPMGGVTPRDMDDFTSDEANEIERILINIDSVFPNLERSYVYSGEVAAGEV